MKTILISTVTGTDKEDVLRALAEKTRELGGEWLISKIIKLDGQLAGLMRLSIDSNLLQSLQKELEACFPDLSFSYIEAETERQAPRTTITLEIDCLDRPGLTRDINNLLYNLDIRVESMDSTRHPIGAVSSTVYSTRVTLSAPLNTSGQDIAAKIEALTPDTRVVVV